MTDKLDTPDKPTLVDILVWYGVKAVDITDMQKEITALLKVEVAKARADERRKANREIVQQINAEVESDD